MLYDKNKTERLSEELFRNPTSEYRGAPFWAWNDELDEAECLRQADIFRKMGFGGYHMHPRAGLATPYLGDKFNACVRACVEDAKEKGMLAWLYDEDRYPSGFAGGFVTKDGRFRRRGLLFTSRKREENATYSAGRQNGGARLLARYSVRLSGGKCLCYRRLAEGEKAAGKVFYAYLIVDEPTDQFNEGGYVDALCKEALDAFADYTYGTYQANVGEEFGKTIPAIFSDEPQMKFLSAFKWKKGAKEAWIPWTDDFAETYKETFGTDVLDVLPELFFDGNSPTIARTRFAYHTHRTERFARAFADNLGVRAASLGISLTGHLMEEPTLDSQSKAVGETMRQYKEFGIPGIDMLCGRHEYTTAKQTESIVRQEGKEGMLCECYGVSRWVAEFGKFKEEGDWLSCLGVTVRVPHLSYYSMRGEAKRDYPPSIFFQAPWYLKFKTLEDHFSRLNTALTRGKAMNEVAVIHPIESYFLCLSAKKRLTKAGKELNARFLALTDWLLFGGHDFDFVSEALLPSQRGEDPRKVGQCAYKTILVPSLLTMRRSTLDYLSAFRAAGGRVVFLGEIPSMIEGIPTPEVQAFAKQCTVLPFEKGAILSSLEENKLFTIRSEKKPEGYLATMREDGAGRWLFLTSPRAGYPYPRSVPVTNDATVIKDRVQVGVKGNWRVTEYDTMSGEIRPLPCEVRDGVTYFEKTLYNYDSLLCRYEAACAPEEGASLPAAKEAIKQAFPLAGGVRYTLDAPNALLLDKAKWSVGDGFHGRMDLDLVTKKARKALGLPPYRSDLQPWLRQPDREKKAVVLRFEVTSELACSAHFACEYKEFTLTVNGERITAEADGFYVDKAFRTTPILLKKGRNILDLGIPMGKYDCCENCYLLGAFGVKVTARKARLTALPDRLFFRDLVRQGLPFYHGKITYHTTFESNGENAEISARYASALLTVRVNGEERDVLYAPYAATLPTKKGENALDLTAYIAGENLFGAVHIRRKYKLSDSPRWFHKTSLPWRVRRYVFDPSGILEDPSVRLTEK